MLYYSKIIVVFIKSTKLEISHKACLQSFSKNAHIFQTIHIFVERVTFKTYLPVFDLCFIKLQNCEIITITLFPPTLKLNELT